MYELFVGKIILFVSIMSFIYFLMKYISENKLVNKTTNKIFDAAETSYSKRKHKKEAQRIEEGNVQNKSFINSIDLLIERSRIKEKLPFLNTEVYISLNIIISMIAFLAGILIVHYWLIGIVCAMFSIIALYAILYIISGINYEMIDKDALTFLNIMENYSGTNDDIVTIMGRTYPYLKNPLKKYVEEFYNECNSTGDLTMAFSNLELKIENERIRDIVRNIEICSRHEANYKEIIEDSRDTLKDYLKSKQNRKAIINNGRLEILMCIVMCFIVLVVFKSFVPDLVHILQANLIGTLILLYNVIVIGIIAKGMISFDKEG